MYKCTLMMLRTVVTGVQVYIEVMLCTVVTSVQVCIEVKLCTV